VKLKKAGFKVTEVCKQLSLDRSHYYRKLVQKPISVEAVKLKVAVRQIHAEMHATYGSRRVCAELRSQGFTVGRYKVRSVMKSLSLKAKRPKQHRYPFAGKPSVIAPNALNRQFNPPMANINWTGDITYIRTRQGWLYLAIVLDLYSRRVVSWAFSNQPNSELSVRALDVAVQHRRPTHYVLFHSDQGVQYSSDMFRSALNKHNITASMSRRGNCHDNAVTERFFRSLKSERVNYRQYKTRDEAMKDIADYIEPFYNQKRRHSTLGNMSPAEYEQKYQQKTLASVAVC
jgi:putative transposase